MRHSRFWLATRRLARMVRGIARGFWERWGTTIVGSLVFAGALVLVSEYREDQRQAAAEKRALQVGLAIERDLRGLTLPGWDLVGIRLSGRNLIRTRLGNADLSNAQLASTNLYRALMGKTNLSEANLSSAYLSGAKLGETNVNSTSFAGADLSNIYLGGAYGASTDFYGAGACGALIVDASLPRADFRYSSLRRADLSYSDFRFADFRSADLRGAVLSHSDLRGAKIRESQLRSARAIGGVQMPEEFLPEMNHPPRWWADARAPCRSSYNWTNRWDRFGKKWLEPIKFRWRLAPYSPSGDIDEAIQNIMTSD